MDDKVIPKKDSKNLKKPFHLKRNVFMLYASRNIAIEPTEFKRIDSGIVTFTPKNGRGFVTSKFREDEIIDISNGEQRLWVEITNRSCASPIEIPKGCVLGFFVAEPEHLQLQYETTTKKIKKAKEKGQKTLSWKKKRQLGGFLNQYDFVYGSRDTVNQAAKVAPGVIKNASNEINNIAKERINQIITQGGKEEQRVLQKILRGAYEDVYQTLFRLLENSGKQQLNKLKRKILN